MGMSSSELYQFTDAVIQKLREAGLDPHPLELVQSTAFTTGSEWLGELGWAVRKIEEHDVQVENLKKDLEAILREVHKVWPNI